MQFTKPQLELLESRDLANGSWGLGTIPISVTFPNFNANSQDVGALLLVLALEGSQGTTGATGLTGSSAGGSSQLVTDLVFLMFAESLTSQQPKHHGGH